MPKGLCNIIVRLQGLAVYSQAVFSPPTKKFPSNFLLDSNLYPQESDWRNIMIDPRWNMTLSKSSLKNIMPEADAKESGTGYS